MPSAWVEGVVVNREEYKKRMRFFDEFKENNSHRIMEEVFAKIPTAMLPHDEIASLRAENTALRERVAKLEAATPDLQMARCLLRSIWQLFDLNGESWGRTMRGKQLELAMALIDLHVPQDNDLRHAYDRDVETSMMDTHLYLFEKNLPEEAKAYLAALRAAGEVQHAE